MMLNIGILVVDDESDTRLMITRMLKSLGYERIIAADDGKTALQRLHYEKIGLILSDWDMPDMNGLDFLRQVRRRSGYRDIPFLMITAIREKDSVIKASQEGVNDYIVKPFTSEVLKKKIDEVLRRVTK